MNSIGCQICPRKCGADRNFGTKGVCGVDSRIMVARAALHYWEEPCISGETGSGAVFFAGCPLHCIFCQNKKISEGKAGKIISRERLAEIFLELQAKGANNINLVTASQYVEDVVYAVKNARAKGLNIPIVYNSSGYELEDSLRLLEGIVDVYLPDFKYFDSKLAGEYSRAEDYPKVAKAALEEMVRQQPRVEFDHDGMIRKGVIVRHLLLPGNVKDGQNVLSYLHDKYGNGIYISMMSQYTPMPGMEEHPKLYRKVTRREYDRYMNHAFGIGIEQGFFQDGKVAEESFIPDFGMEGV